MAHMISNIDRQQGIEMAWHKLTEIRPDLSLADCWLADWDVRKEKLYTGDMTETEYCQLVATDNPRIHIGAPVHCETYQPVSNADFLATVRDALFALSGVTVASVGSVCERGRVFVSVKLAELDSFKAAGREHKAYLNFLNSHDQSCAFIVNTSNVCTVCNNTFSMNLHSADKGAVRIKLKHTKNIAMKLENVPEIIDGFLGAQAEFRALMDNFARQEITPANARNVFAGFIGSNAEGELSTRKANQIDRLSDLFANGAGNNGRDLSDVFNAVTDYYSHESSGGENAMRQVVSSEYGAGQTAKARMFGILQDRDVFGETLIAGAKLLAAN